MTARILIVDDEPQLLRALRINLTARHYEVAMAADGREALDSAARRVPDLFLLDLSLGGGIGGIDGIEVIAALRGWSRAPILVLSGRIDAADQIAAFDAGADDYVTKPFVMEELMARIRALLRRAEAQRKVDLAVVVGDHIVDMIAKTVTRSEQAPASAPPTVHLTKTEWAVLEVLVKNPGRVVSSKKLLQDVWGAAYTKETGYLRFYMAKLRKKLEPDPSRPRQLVTEAGTGYRFQP
jgi:two-component system, OmpR family, KDP operon response regulator KdpE